MNYYPKCDDYLQLQEDVQLSRKGESFEIVEVVNLGDIYEDIQILQTSMY